MTSLGVKLHVLNSDRKPGDIEALTDYLLEDYKNFPKVPEFGEETACFIRKEMEDTWGSKHLSVLPKAEAQHWILGVGFFTHFHFGTSDSSPSKNSQIFQGLHRTPYTKYKQDTYHFPEHLSWLLNLTSTNSWCALHQSIKFFTLLVLWTSALSCNLFATF